jgi:dolichol-phosphate mannosyltransferase
MSFLTKPATVLASERFSRLVKFGIVGTSGIVVNNAMLWLLVQNGLGDVAASVIATETAIITNFLGNALWTWREHKEGPWYKKFLMFQAISVFAGALTVMLFWVFKNQLGMPLLVANTTAIFITFTINFMLNKRFTWGKAQ